MSTRRPSRSSPEWADDPVVREVRAVRRKLLQRAGGTVEGYFRLMDEITQTRTQASSSARRRAPIGPKGGRPPSPRRQGRAA